MSLPYLKLFKLLMHNFEIYNAVQKPTPTRILQTLHTSFLNTDNNPFIGNYWEKRYCPGVPQLRIGCKLAKISCLKDTFLFVYTIFHSACLKRFEFLKQPSWILTVFGVFICTYICSIISGKKLAIRQEDQTFHTLRTVRHTFTQLRQWIWFSVVSSEQ